MLRDMVVYMRTASVPGSAARSRTTRAFAASVALGALLVVLTPHTVFGALPTTSTPVLTLTRTIRTTPFVGTTTSTKDAEGTAFVARDNSLWLVGDNGRSAYEIDPYTGVLKRIISRSVFEAAPVFGGTRLAGSARSGDLESLAYDDAKDTLYAFSGNCCTTSALPTAFRLTRSPLSGDLEMDSYQPLPLTADYTGSAWSPLEGKVYVGKAGKFRTYDYITNTSGPEFRVAGVSGIHGLDFTADGRDLMIVTGEQRMIRIDWATKKIVTGWDFDLTQFGVMDGRGVEVVPNQTDSGRDDLYVYDGYDDRATGDPLRYAVFVFEVSGDGGGGV